MLKFILKIIGFTLFCILVYAILIIVWIQLIPQRERPNLIYHPTPYSHINTRLEEVKSMKDIDILFLGSSHAYRTFDTRIYDSVNLTTFNLGSSAQTPTQTHILLKRYLETLNPRLVVFEIFPAVFSFDGIESSIELLSNDKTDRYSLELILKKPDIRTINCLIYSSFKYVLNNRSAYLNEPWKINEDLYIKGGFVEKKLKYFKDSVYPEKEVWNIRDDQVKEFKKAISFLKQKQIPYILVQAPISQAWFNNHTNNEEFDSLMKTQGQYYDFNRLMLVDDSLHFYDHHHLNQNGVTFFNQKFIEAIILPYFNNSLQNKFSEPVKKSPI